MAKKAYTEERLLIGNCLATLKTLPDNSIDSVVTDPPYELGFMGKSWDSTGIAFNTEVWQECIRVLKPGGHLIAFSGSRTYHRMAVAIEDAGFEIRDQIMWVYGSGFPKSHNIEKAINKVNGVEFLEKPASGVGFMNAEGAGGYNTTINQLEQVGESTKEAKQWQGWGTALKPAHEPMVLARKPLSEKTVAANVLQHGTGAINIDGSRVGTTQLGGGTMPDLRDVGAMSKEATGIDKLSFGQNPRPADRIEQPTYTGRFPANFILTHNHDCQEISEGSIEVNKKMSNTPDMRGNNYGRSDKTIEIEMSTYKDTPAVWSCTPGCPTTQFPDTKSQQSMRGLRHSGRHGGVSDLGSNIKEGTDSLRGFDDSGTAARFFYCAKASKSERNAGLEGLPTTKIVTFQTGNGASGKASSISEGRNTEYKNFHPTVKPVALMRYLTKLITPPNGTVLDPFLGSGTTAVAAILEDFEWKGCEMTDDYLPIIKARVDWAIKEKKKEQPKLL